MQNNVLLRRLDTHSISFTNLFSKGQGQVSTLILQQKEFLRGFVLKSLLLYPYLPNSWHAISLS